MDNITVSAVITAAGSGTRFDKTTQKQFEYLGAKPLFLYSVETLSQCEYIKEIVITVPRDSTESTHTIIRNEELSKVSGVVVGGETRQDSVAKGIKSLRETPDIVLVHDGVRPFVSTEMINSVIEQAVKHDGAITAIAASDTIKQTPPENSRIEHTVEREGLWYAQTPQAFKYDVIREAFARAADDGFVGTDEAQLAERIGADIEIIEGSPFNIKITTKDDMEMARLILNSTKRG